MNLKRHFLIATIIFSMLFIASCKGCNWGKSVPNFKDEAIPYLEKMRLLKKSAPVEERIKELVISEIKKDIPTPLVSKINIFFATSIAKTEINSSGKEGKCKYNFIYKESEEDKVLKLISGKITFNYIWKETLKNWVEIRHGIEEKKQEDTGSIKGRIINGITKDPIMGAIVYGEERTKTPHEYTLAYRTNNEGYFLINYVCVGNYYVYGIKEGFLKNLTVNIVVEKDKTTDIGTIYLLSQETTKVATIRGRVVDNSRNLVKEATVYLESAQKKETLPITSTSSEGNYTLSFVFPGEYKLIARKEDISNFINVTVTKREVEKKQVIKVEDIILNNHPPIISEVKLDRNILGVNEVTTITVKAKDLDNDKLWYYWSCNEGIFVQTCQEEAIWQAPSIEGNYRVTVLAKDKKSGETSFSINIPIVYSIKTKDISPIDLCYEGVYLWMVDNKSNYIRKIHPGKNEIVTQVLVLLERPQICFSGITYDGRYFYITDKANDKIHKVSKEGKVITSFDSPGHSPQGLVYDGKYLWNADYGNNKLYKIDPENGEMITSFNSPGSSPRGLAFDGNYLWNSDSGSDAIYQIDPSTGVVITSFPAPGKDPRGIVHDGTYFWCIDEGVATIYRLRLSDYL